jgi:2-C-methyl-D-erythritol 4-phosphate cytidylyltransferase
MTPTVSGRASAARRATRVQVVIAAQCTNNNAGMDVWGIVLAAGTAERFGGGKQWAELGGERLVDRSVATATGACDDVVVVLEPGAEWDGPPVTAAVAGGNMRAESVRAGLAVVPDWVDVVVVHDAAHPLASPALFEAVIDEVRNGAEAAVPVLPATETVVEVQRGALASVGTTAPLALAQMPHAFNAHVLRDAHREQAESRDDASLLLALGRRVVAVAGETTNVHVTTREELVLAERMLALPGATSRGPKRS